MRKLMTLMLGLSLVMGAVSVSFAQDPPKKEGKKKELLNKPGTVTCRSRMG
jgi:hypothetical protein